MTLIGGVGNLFQLEKFTLDALVVLSEVDFILSHPPF
jgi:hypothetical protein